MDEIAEGLIRKGIGGFYYVETPDGIVECRARGLFRRLGMTPLAGDRVRIRLSGDGTGTLEEILPRRNALIRPPAANIQQMVIVVSTCEPSPNQLVIDRMIVEAEAAGVEPILVISKTDLRGSEDVENAYRNSGIPLFCISSRHAEEAGDLKKLLPGKTTVFAGNTGVGKSTLLNSMFHSLSLETGEISQKLGRGRHTTRQVELLKMEGCGGYVVDTPGFSSFDTDITDAVTLEQLPYYFREFRPYLERCRFSTCSHTCEEGCAVVEAVQEGKISRQRHESYILLYQEMKEKKPWQKKKTSV